LIEWRRGEKNKKKKMKCPINEQENRKRKKKKPLFRKKGTRFSKQLWILKQKPKKSKPGRG